MIKRILYFKVSLVKGDRGSITSPFRQRGIRGGFRGILLFCLLLFSPPGIQAVETNFTLEITGSNITPAPESAPGPNIPGPPVCNNQKPGSAPKLLSATSGLDSITLVWEKALDPVTHYLLAYGTTSSEIKFGSPNIGDHNTTGYTVKGLISDKIYFFKIQAINGCMPGDFSNEISARPIKSEISILPSEEILEEIIITPIPVSIVTIFPGQVGAQEKLPLFDIQTVVTKPPINFLIFLWLIPLTPLSIFSFLFFWKRRKK